MTDWYKDALAKIERMPEAAKELRNDMLADLWTFAKIMNPMYLYGEVHRDVYRWLQSNNDQNQLALIPRAHLKSHMIAVWCAWWITKNPDTSILYLSATSTLSETQLYAIKNIMESGPYQRYFPDIIHPEEGQRERWTTERIAVDHPKRRGMGIRDWTVVTAGLSTNTTGWHADVIICDDIVVPSNAYTQKGRDDVVAAMSQMTSIRNAGGFTKAVGTRYHPSDIYATWKNQKTKIYDEMTGDLISEQLIWDIWEEQVERDGVFLWPREVRPSDYKAFGFSLNILARIQGEYEDISQFHAQYYNNPNGGGTGAIDSESFQYYNEKFLSYDGEWKFKGERINVYAAIDFAFSTSKRADYTAIVVIGIDHAGRVYVLDIDRFKTDKISKYFDRIADMHSKWRFRKLRTEVSVGQKVIVNQLKDKMKEEGLRISVDEHRPTRHDGSKEERMYANLNHRYEQGLMYHRQGGFTRVLEDELTSLNPPHDDVKDTLACACSIAVKPKAPKNSNAIKDFQSNRGVSVNKRFGGVSFR